MKELLGLYIEDDISNVMVQQARFDLFEGIRIKGLETLTARVEDIYPNVIRE